MIETKAILVSNTAQIQNRTLTVTMKIEEGKVDLVRLSFNGKGEIFSLPVEQLSILIDVLQQTEDDCKKVTSLPCT